MTAGSAGELHSHLFIRPDGRQLAFVWDKRSSPTVELRLPRVAGRVTAHELNGESRPWAETEGRAIRGIRLEPGAVRIFEAESR